MVVINLNNPAKRHTLRIAAVYESVDYRQCLMKSAVGYFLASKPKGITLMLSNSDCYYLMCVAHHEHPKTYKIGWALGVMRSCGRWGRSNDAVDGICAVGSPFKLCWRCVCGKTGDRLTEWRGREVDRNSLIFHPRARDSYTRGYGMCITTHPYFLLRQLCGVGAPFLGLSLAGPIVAITWPTLSINNDGSA